MGAEVDTFSVVVYSCSLILSCLPSILPLLKPSPSSSITRPWRRTYLQLFSGCWGRRVEEGVSLAVSIGSDRVDVEGSWMEDMEWDSNKQTVGGQMLVVVGHALQFVSGSSSATGVEVDDISGSFDQLKWKYKREPVLVHQESLMLNERFHCVIIVANKFLMIV